MVIVYALIALAVIVVITLVVSMMFRVVVATNEVHIVQRNKRSVSYGNDQDAGNVYFSYPSWLPFIGISRIILPVSNFNIELKGYEAYDKQKVPFEVDVIGFFRISDPIKAAQRISSFEDLNNQLSSVMNGAIRKVLAGQEIIKIMESRNIISDEFTNEVKGQLSNWWVESVKNVELMDLRDSESSESNVISNIMIRKTSEIERESRIEVANNKRDAELAEIDATRAADVQRQDAEKQIGEKEAEKEKAVWVAKEKAKQEVQIEAKITMEKDMDVFQVEQVKTAEIERDKAVIDAGKEKQMKVIAAEALKAEQEQQAEADLITQTKSAEGNLITQLKNAEGIKAVGESSANAKELMEVALVAGAIQLAAKIAQNPEYMSYLQNIEAIKATQAVWTAQAEALKDADIKIMANTGTNLGEGITSIGDMVSAKGGTALAGLLENLSNTENGAKLVEKIVWTKKEDKKQEDVKQEEVKKEDVVMTADEVIEQNKNKKDVKPNSWK